LKVDEIPSSQPQKMSPSNLRIDEGLMSLDFYVFWDVKVLFLAFLDVDNL
jgi:hypothetical protein